jgi:hypothetical protein
MNHSPLSDEASVVPFNQTSTLPQGAVAQLHVNSGLHAGTVVSLEQLTHTISASPDADLVLLDMGTTEISIEHNEDDDSWWLYSTGADVRVDGQDVEPYESVCLPTTAEIAYRNVRIAFVTSSPDLEATASPDSERAQATEAVSAVLREQPPVAREKAFSRWAMGAAGVGLGIVAATVWIGSSASPDAPISLKAPNPSMSAKTPTKEFIDPNRRQRLDREQIVDYVNSHRLNIAVQAVSETEVQLAWTGMDTVSPRTQQAIGDTIFGRNVRWVPSTQMVVAEDSHAKNSKNNRRAAVDRGNQQTEETLRNLGLVDIAQVQATGRQGRYIVTRSGHRVFEGSELRSGATLSAVGIDEMTVVSNGVTMLVPYDLAKPVKKVATILTANTLSVSKTLAVPSSSAQKQPVACANQDQSISGTSVAMCSSVKKKIPQKNGTSNFNQTLTSTSAVTLFND